MIPQINRILYATDLSPNAQPAFTYAASLAENYRATLYVLHVLEVISYKPYLQVEGFKGENEWKSIEEEREAAALHSIEEKLNVMCSEMNSHIPTCSIKEEQIMIRKGTPVEEIIKAAEEIEIQLIVMGTHGYGMVQDALMGGTARRLVRRSVKPVLIVPHLTSMKD